MDHNPREYYSGRTSKVKGYNSAMGLLLGMPIPPLRPDLDINSLETEKGPVAVVSDMFGLEELSLAMPLAMMIVAGLFDGKRRAAEVSLALQAQKAHLPEAEIEKIAQELDRHGLLDTPATKEKRRAAFVSFQKSTIRPFHAKSRGLPPEPLPFSALLSDFQKSLVSPSAPSALPLGLVAPHIDFFRGGTTYAQTYAALASTPPPDVVVALGVAHMSPRSPWVMTKKSYETPHGALSVHETLYNEIRERLWYDPLEEEWVHAKEHSLEFQALWLKHLWRDKTPQWVPILTSSFERWCGDRAPSSAPAVEKALRDIGALLVEQAKKGKRILILAGIDLAHVGRRFGDELDITDEIKEKVEASDRRSLEKAFALDADGFFMEGVGENAWRKVCGLSALTTAVRWIQDLSGGRARGSLIAYDQKPDPAGGIVSFAGASFTSPAS
jgi:MEMO1 family protein